MIITQTPFRMSFFGGGTDFPDFYREYGGAVLSTTFDKYCYVTVRHLPPFFEYSSEIVYSARERVRDANEIEHPAIRNAMKMLDIRDLRLTYEADLPARSGLGTSSSFAVGMLSAFHALKGEYVSKKRLADDAIYLERVLCDETGGVQDQIAAAYGGLNHIGFDENGYCVSPLVINPVRKKQLNDHLLLFFTGFSRFSSNIQVKTQAALKEKRAQLLEIRSLVDEAEAVLTSSADLKEFGRLLHHSWRLKRGITNKVSTDAIDALYEKALRAGADGGKLLGAGGGGFLLFFVEPDKQSSVRKALEGLLSVPFRFENEGTRIVHFAPEMTAQAYESDATVRRGTPTPAVRFAAAK